MSTRRGVYFAIARLLVYPAPYDRPLYRFADFNAGQYASRNAAFQSALTQSSGIPLDLDGDVLRYERGEPASAPGSTELADRASGKAVPRAVVPQIPLASPNITRNLTTEWFATRVETRYRNCRPRMRG